MEWGGPVVLYCTSRVYAHPPAKVVRWFTYLEAILYNFDQFVSHTSHRGQKIRFDPDFTPDH